MPERTETAVPLVSLPDAGSDEVGVLGGRTRILVRPDQVGEAYAVLEQVVPPGKGPPLHVHRHETEIFYIVDGSFEFQVGDRTLTVGPGANLVAPRDIPHTFRNAGAVPGKLLLTVIPGRFGNYFIEVDAVADPDRETVRRLAAKYDVELLD